MSTKQRHCGTGLEPGQKRLSFGGVPVAKRSRLADLFPPLQQRRDASGSSFTQCPVCGKQVPLPCINLHLDTQCTDLAATGAAAAGAGGTRGGTLARTVPATAVPGKCKWQAQGQASERRRRPSAAAASGLTMQALDTEDRLHEHPAHQLQQQQPEKQQHEDEQEDKEQQRPSPEQWQQQQQELALVTVEAVRRGQAPATRADPRSYRKASTGPAAADAPHTIAAVEVEAAPGDARDCARGRHAARAAVSPPLASSSSAADAGVGFTADICDDGDDGVGDDGGDGGGGGGGGDGGGDDGRDGGGSRNSRRQGVGLALAALHPVAFQRAIQEGAGKDGQTAPGQVAWPAGAAVAAAATCGPKADHSVGGLADSDCGRPGRGGQGKQWWLRAGAMAEAVPCYQDEDGKAGTEQGERGPGSSSSGGACATVASGASLLGTGLPMLRSEPHPSLEGQYLVSEFITPAEEAELLSLCDDPVLKPSWGSWSGQSYANATAQKTRGKRWGVLPDYHRRGVAPMEHPLPPLLRLLVERMRARVGLLRSFFPNEANAIDYRRSRGSWLRAHVDDRVLSGDLIVNLCLAGAAVMSFARAPQGTPRGGGGGLAAPAGTDGRHGQTSVGQETRVMLPARSLQILSRAARYSYTHAINPVDLLDERRVSITFRRSELRPFEKAA